MNNQATAVPSDSSNSSALGILTGLLHSRLSRRSRNALTAYVAFEALRPKVVSTFTKVRNHVEHIVTVNDDDALYPEIQAWLLEQIPTKRRRSLLARTGSAPRPYEVEDSPEVVAYPGSPTPQRVERSMTLTYDGTRQQTVTIGGHRIRVSISREEAKHEPGQRRTRRWESEAVVFKADSAAGRDAVITFLKTVMNARVDTPPLPRFYMALHWGDWDRRDQMALRPKGSVVLAEGVKEHLFEDIARFRAREADYLRLGIPFHRGYLLYGPPGSGKSSVAKAIASELRMDIYYISLSDLREDASLLNLISRVSPGSMLLLEDIDVVHAATSRTESAFGGVTLSGLLNSLDGVSTPHGLVVVMTTNHVEVLDEALIRDGRADVRVAIDNLVPEQYDRLVLAMTGAPPLKPMRPDAVLSAAAVVGICKANIGDPDATAQALAEAEWSR